MVGMGRQAEPDAGALTLHDKLWNAHLVAVDGERV